MRHDRLLEMFIKNKQYPCWCWQDMHMVTGFVAFLLIDGPHYAAINRPLAVGNSSSN